MKTTEYISITIDRFPKGYVFTYSDFNLEVYNKETVIKSLNRMVASGRINKLAKGKYYKPELSAFGSLLPQQSQIVKDLLEDNGKLTGYLTGYSIYNQLGLTTQVSNIIQIGKNELRHSFRRQQYKIVFVKQKNIITKGNIHLLQILDAIRYIQKIPDASIEFICKRLTAIIVDLSERDINSMIRLSMKYPPATRALLGALLDETNNNIATEQLYKSLNPITVYKLSGVINVLNSAKKWNIE